METDRIIGVVVVCLCFVALIIWNASLIKKRVARDWEIVDDLEKRSVELNTCEEILVFHKEFTEKASKIHNEFINLRLARIDGYLRGQYKALGGK